MFSTDPKLAAGWRRLRLVVPCRAA